MNYSRTCRRSFAPEQQSDKKEKCQNAKHSTRPKEEIQERWKKR